jgi:ubiquinone/menaquinone biosynthesis C-methylase UbiE
MRNDGATPKVPGLILHAAWSYDLLVGILTLGRERSLRRKMLRPARLQPGESVLDVGCGTGSLALEAKRAVGPSGLVYGVDASPEMIARAGRKARKAGLEIAFANAPAQALPFPDGRFDVAVSSMMLHHLPRSSREQCAREMRRVVKPGGRALAIDFDPAGRGSGFLDRLRLHRHGNLKPGELAALFAGAGLIVVEMGAVGFRSLQFVLATAPR